MKSSIVVVVKGKEIYFKDYEDLEAINKGDGSKPLSREAIVKMGGYIEGIETILIIRAKIHDNTKVIAVFNKWDYWRYLPT